MTSNGIAKLLLADCEVLEKAGLCCHFDGVIGPEAERIAAGVTVRDCGELIAAGAEYSSMHAFSGHDFSGSSL
jgi:hypothetical protein